MSSSRQAAPYISIVAWPNRDLDPQEWAGLLEKWRMRIEAFGLNAEVVPAEGRAGRNAAIKHARGEFILSVAADLEPSEELLQFLAAREFQSDRFYRIDLREGNTLHAREGSFPLTAEDLRANAAADITDPAAGIHFGDGWFAAEHDRITGEVFRWLGNQGEIRLRTPAAGGALEIELEPGPGIAELPARLVAVDGAGTNVAEWGVEGRTRLLLWPPEGTSRFRLSAPDGGRGIPGDLRILNFRVFRCVWSSPRPRGNGTASLRPVFMGLLRAGHPQHTRPALDLVRSLSDDVFGPGIEHWSGQWHRLEETEAGRFRWLGNTAEVIVRGESGASELQLLLEPGPSLHGRPFRLQIRLADEIIASPEIKGLTLVRAPLPLFARAVAALSLSPDTPGDAVPGDGRVLSARVLACSCLPSRSAALKPRADQRWTSAIAAQQPAGIDWRQRLSTQARELAEIGRPPLLHINACEFLLMSRQLWRNLRGYAEARVSNEWLDALVCYNAFVAGATEELLAPPMRLVRSRSEGVVRAPMPEDLGWILAEMRRLHTPAILNAEPWSVE